jgi:glycosyltransferase involved in cell wall biosynthesis
VSKPKLLIVGDFAKHSGFARVNESIAWQLSDRWDIAVLGVNYHGDYTPLQQHYRLYPAWIGGDAYGYGRIGLVADVERPDAILITADPWHTAGYVQGLLERDGDWIPAVLYAPVDATGIRPADVALLDWLQHVVAYTQFGADELRRAGVTAPISIIPHGVDRALFTAVGRDRARQAAGVPEDLYIVLVLDRNQPRKRLDIAFAAFAAFAQDKPDARLWYHGALQEETGWDIGAMAADLGIADKLMLTTRDMRPLAGVPPQQLKYVYSLADVKLSTSAGEGWGLTTMEAMACGVPCLAPDYAALGEWARGAIGLIEASIPTRHVKVNTVGRVPSIDEVVDALDYVYHHPAERSELSRRGLERVAAPQFDWANIADAFDTVLRRAMWRETTVQVIEPASVEVAAC